MMSLSARLGYRSPSASGHPFTGSVLWRCAHLCKHTHLQAREGPKGCVNQAREGAKAVVVVGIEQGNPQMPPSGLSLQKGLSRWVTRHPLEQTCRPPSVSVG